MLGVKINLVFFGVNFRLFVNFKPPRNLVSGDERIGIDSPLDPLSVPLAMYS